MTPPDPPASLLLPRLLRRTERPGCLRHTPAQAIVARHQRIAAVPPLASLLLRRASTTDHTAPAAPITVTATPAPFVPTGPDPRTSATPPQKLVVSAAIATQTANFLERPYRGSAASGADGAKGAVGASGAGTAEGAGGTRTVRGAEVAPGTRTTGGAGTISATQNTAGTNGARHASGARGLGYASRDAGTARGADGARTAGGAPGPRSAESATGAGTTAGTVAPSAHPPQRPTITVGVGSGGASRQTWSPLPHPAPSVAHTPPSAQAPQGDTWSTSTPLPSAPPGRDAPPARDARPPATPGQAATPGQ